MTTQSSPDQSAATWFARLQTGDLTSQERADFSRWLVAQEANAVAFARVEFAWERAECLKALRESRSDEVNADEITGARWCARSVGGVAAAVAAVAVIAGATWLLNESTSYATTVGEQRSVSLADGSQVHLNTETELRVLFDGNSRKVRLDHGEALFEVARDASRTFTVQAADTEVSAVGTAFNVRLRGHEVVEVTVTEGKILLDCDEGDSLVRWNANAGRALESGASRGGGAGSHTRSMLVSEGYAAIAAAGACEKAHLSGDAIDRRVMWRKGVIEFHGDTLEQAVSEFNRYRRHRIVIADPSLALQRVGGRFGTDESDEFVNAVKAQFSVRTRTNEHGEIYLLRAE